MKFNKTLLIALLLTIGLLNAGRAQAFTFYQFNFIKLLPGLNLNLSLIPTSILTKMSFGYNLTSSRWCQDSTVECKKELNLSNNRCDTTYSLCVSMQQGTEAGCQYVKEKCLVNNQKVYEECINRYIGNENRCWLTLPAKTCDASDTKACNTATGAPGTQTADYCNTVTGEWVWGDCIANPPPPPPPPPTDVVVDCVPLTPQTQYLSCPSGQTGTITQQRTSSCPGPTWSAWTTVSNTCTAPPPGTCTSFDYSAWSTCANGTQTRTVTASFPSGCTGGTPITSQSCSVTCTSFDYSAWSSCENGWQSRTVTASYPAGCTGGSPVTLQSCCSGSQPACPTGWLGSYTCYGNSWWNTCVPPGPDYCYRGAKYKIYNGAAYSNCLGAGQGTCTINGDTRYYMLNQCSSLQQYNSWGSEPSIKTYIDAMYDTSIPNSCDPSFVYTQC